MKKLLLFSLFVFCVAASNSTNLTKYEQMVINFNCGAVNASDALYTAVVTHAMHKVPYSTTLPWFA